jgi:hypothetical protein
VLLSAALALGFPGALATPGAAQADSEFVRVTPSTIQAGFQVEIEAFCDDTVNPATVSSAAFGTVTITPSDTDETDRVLDRGSAMVPNGTRPGPYRVMLRCPSQRTATTTLHVVSPGPTISRGPQTGGGGLAHDNRSRLLIGAGSAAAAAGVVLLILGRRRRA